MGEMTSSDKTSDQAGWRISSLERLYRQSRFFDWSIQNQDLPTHLLLPQDPWRGQAERGQAFFNAEQPYKLTDPYYHTLEWLRDLRDFGGNRARQLAREHLQRLMGKMKRWDEQFWQPDQTGRRIAHLLFTYSWFGSSADEAFQADIIQFLARQMQALALDWQKLADSQDQISALKGLLLGQVSFGADSEEAAQILALILPRIHSQINPDFGHISRQPERHLDLLRDIFECRLAAALAGYADQNELSDIVSKMGAVAKMWRHGDGSFAHFHGAGRSTSSQIEEVVARCGPRGRIVQQAPHTGFIRLASGRNTLIMDAGPAQSDGLSEQAQSQNAPSSLAFEFSVGTSPFIVNSGQYSSDAQLTRLLRQSVAHSTLTLDGMDSSAPTDGRQAQLYGVEVGPAPDGLLIEASHDGFDKSHGIHHMRQLYLKSGGGNLRGMDKLIYTGAPGLIAQEAHIRFHLHPRVSAARLQQGSILMKIRGQKAGWHFKCRGGTARLDNSIYIDQGRRVSCQQIVLSVPLGDIRSLGEIAARWAFARADTQKSR